MFEKLANQYLCPPGNGVFTVNTAKERKESLHSALYGNVDEVETAWQKSLSTVSESDDFTVMLGVCSDTGGGILRGANWGPLFLRNAILAQHGDSYPLDMGDVRVIPHLLHDKYLNEPTIDNCRKALYQGEGEDLAVSPLSITEKICDAFYESHPNKGIFAMGGDHSVSYPLVKSYLAAKKKQGKKAAIIHFDAHTDLLIERLGIDLCFGSWCTHILEGLDEPSLLMQYGIRSSGKPKAHWEETFGVKQYWAQDVLSRGAQVVADETVEILKQKGVDEIYVSFDIDGLDARYASATGTPEVDGLSPTDAHTIIDTIGQHFPITGADMVEIAPFVVTENADDEPRATLEAGAAISAQLIKLMNKNL
ncbi:arginase family protein [Aliikangiella sp. G2MR2-5]|uniref:arginase family protein n=1 Tax=Aliikangiella sp. G2MR2-5 TaxID=2788943 RepID=UPI0018AA26BD|nr:arginase family protein [Aliikangiella sp. G2MR2-5]